MPRLDSRCAAVVALALGLLMLGAAPGRLGAAGPVCTVGATGATYASLAAALADAGCASIQIAAGTFATNVSIERSVTIEGAGPGATRLDGGGSARGERVIFLDGDYNVELRNLALVNGDTGVRAGAGVYSTGALTLTNVLVQGNRGGGTAGVYNSGVMVIIDSTIDGNQGDSAGGLLNDGTLTMRGSTVSGNSGATSGLVNTSLLTVVNSTFSGNRSPAGAVLNNFSGAAVIQFTTIFSNTGGADGEALASSALVNPTGASLSLLGSIIARNGPGPSCAGAITSQGHNLADDTSCGLGGAGDRAGVDPLLGPLAANGGATSSHRPQRLSPAIDGGPAAGCPATDQRGVARPADGDGAGDAACDIGAVEVTLPSATTFLPLIQR